MNKPELLKTLLKAGGDLGEKRVVGLVASMTNKEASPQYLNRDPVSKIIYDAVCSNEDYDDIKTDINYAIDQLTRAKKEIPDTA